MTTELFDDEDWDQPDAADSGPQLWPIEEGSRRKFPHPETGKPAWFTRATQFAGTVADDYTLGEWKIALAVAGVAKSRGLYALANSEPIPPEHMEDRAAGWWRPWAELGHQGMDYMDSRNGAHLGTAFHRWGEEIDRGNLDPQDVPEEWQAHAEAFVRVHEEQGMVTRTEYLERFIWNPLDRGVCGRSDAFRELPDGSLVVDDTKTGRQAPMGLDEIAIQLAIYAHAPYLWNPVDQAWEAAPPNIRKDIATVTWVPINNPDAAEVIPVDIAVGWEAAKATAWFREYRRRAKRKNNGLRLSPGALAASQGRSLRKYTHSEIAARIAACGSLDAVSALYLELLGSDQLNPMITELLEHRKRELKN